MTLEGKNIGYVFTGSFCTFKKSIEELKNIIKQKANVIPIMSFNSYNENTKFGKAQDFIKEIEDITGNKIIHMGLNRIHNLMFPYTFSMENVVIMVIT